MKRSPVETNGHSTTKIDRLIAYHRDALDHLEATKQLLVDDAVARKTKTAKATWTHAVTLDAARRASTRPAKSQRAGVIKAQRQHSAKILAALSTSDPRPLPRKATALLRHGYIVKKGDGYVRTSKAFSVAKP